MTTGMRTRSERSQRWERWAIANPEKYALAFGAYMLAWLTIVESILAHSLRLGNPFIAGGMFMGCYFVYKFKRPKQV